MKTKTTEQQHKEAVANVEAIATANSIRARNKEITTKTNLAQHFENVVKHNDISKNITASKTLEVKEQLFNQFVHKDTHKTMLDYINETSTRTATLTKKSDAQIAALEAKAAKTLEAIAALKLKRAV